MNYIKKDIQENPQAYPLLANYWEFSIGEVQKDFHQVIFNYKFFQTRAYHGEPFYKAISRPFEFDFLLFGNSHGNI